ncbi:MAG: DsbA family oxidoreductase [Ilumatobacteraceae bacterium]|jgi:predicted DsbA family dithiol-disulfide isomerase|nr:DsbA family oxidoreductase [Ilumatobacteraceae bacterium]
MPTVVVDVWSDVVCPWCYIGKRRFERAVEQLRGEIDVEVRFRPYQLDPRAPAVGGTPVAEAYARKFGGPERAAAIIDHVTGIAAGEGLEFRMDRAIRSNTLLAHRLLWWAEQDGAPVDQAVLKERLLRAYFHDGLDVGDPATLATLLDELGVDPVAAAGVLDGADGLAEVMAHLEHANDHGITAVPTYVIDGAWAVPGAQEPETFVQVLRRMAERSGT